MMPEQGLDQAFEEMLKRGAVKEAFDYYWDKLGNYSSLGRQAGECLRGASLLQRLVNALGSWGGAAQLNRTHRAMIYNDYALFLTDIGELTTARDAFEKYLELTPPRSRDRSRAMTNLCWINLAQGRLPAALAWAQNAAEVPMDWCAWTMRSDATAYAATAYALLGATSNADALFRAAIQNPPGYNYSQLGVFEVDHLIRCQRTQRARELAARNLEFCERHDSGRDVARCHAQLGRLSLDQGNIESAAEHFAHAEEWTRDDAEFRLRLIGLRAALARARGESDEAMSQLQNGIALAAACGYRIYEVDLLIDCGDLALAIGHCELAEERFTSAVQLASELDTAYFWGQTRALHQLVRAASGRGASNEASAHLQRLNYALEDRSALWHQPVSIPDIAMDAGSVIEKVVEALWSSDSPPSPAEETVPAVDEFPSSSSSNRMLPPENPARRLLRQLRQTAGAYPDWPDWVQASVSKILRVHEINPAVVSLAGLGVPVDEQTLDDSVKGFEQLYGLRQDGPDWLEQLLQYTRSFHPPEAQDAIERIVAGLLPRLTHIDPWTGEVTALRIANGFSIDAGDSYSLVGLTTAFVKLIQDWSALISSTGPAGGMEKSPAAVLAELFTALTHPQRLAEMMKGFAKSPTEILDGLARSVEVRWVNLETSPTWEFNYTPEEIAADPEWLLRNSVCNAIIQTFFLCHEIGHVHLGHLRAANTIGLRAGDTTVSVYLKARGEELDADSYAATVLARIAKAAIDAMPDGQPLVQWALVQLVKFLGYVDLLEEFSNNEFNTHPPSQERIQRVVEAIAAESIPGIDTVSILAHSSFLSGAYSSVRRRLSKG